MIRALLTVLALGMVVPPPRLPPTRGSTKTGELGQLRKQAGGGYFYRDDKAGFVAEIRPDGTVRFRDAHLGPQQLTPKIFGYPIDGSGRRPEAKVPFRDDLIPHGPYGPPPILITTSVKFGGLADAAQSSRRAAAKQKFLHLTEPMREQMAAKWRAERAQSALVALSHDLLKQWRDRSVPLSIRKEQLFRQWDDCDEPQAGDDLATHAGAMARTRIEKFIRRHARMGSENAFTDQELADFDRRRQSKARFDPYAPRGTANTGSPAPSSSSSSSDR